MHTTPNTTPNFSNNLTEDEKNIIIKGLLCWQDPYTQWIYSQFWFEYKNNTTNTIREEYRKEITEVVEKYGSKIYLNIQNSKV